MKAKDKKKNEQLGMSYGKAAHRLSRDIMWNLIVQSGKSICCKCGKEMSREDFSIEHLTPWLDSENPVRLYFDINNIGFSHHICNVSSARQTRKKPECGTKSKYTYGCRCDLCKDAQSKLQAEYRKKTYCPVKRREKYIKRGT